MLSEKQVAANRAIAQLPTGPKAEEGKRRSSLNARRHNLTGQVTAMTSEDRAARDAFSAGLIKSLAPEGELEIALALGLSRHADDNIDHPELQAAFAAAKTFTAEGKSIELLTLYEQRLNRTLQKNLAVLQSLQALRKAEAASKPVAAKPAQVHEMKAAAASDNASGFVFSNDRTPTASVAVTGPPSMPPTGASGLHAISSPR